MRNVSSKLVQALMEEVPFKYAHLVKFEKPVKTESGKPTRNATSYSYITDASIDISYDDGSTNARGISNGSQIYVANRLIDVSSIAETVEARASNFSVTIGASALNTTTTATFTITGTGPYTLSSNKNLVEEGFLEGDEIYITGGASNWTGRIDRFTTSGGILNAAASVTLVEGTASVSATNIVLNTKDVGALLLPKNGSSYARYINREIFVYKAHIDVNNGAIIGNPYLLFKGIITSGSLSEDSINGSKMTWSISSHWGDWVRVNGRLTSDSHHRAVNNQGFSDRAALLRPEYADDLGFMHSEQALNIVATYKASETRYKMKKSGLFGLKRKLKEYQVLVDREVDLRFNLEAKYLPVVYGVQRLDTIPFFADTDKSNPNKVYVAYALCEGEIAGIYDIYLGNQSSVCLDANDESTRSVAPESDTIDVLCSGRADRGDVLTEQAVDSSGGLNFAGSLGINNGFFASVIDRYYSSIDAGFAGAVAASPNSSGITHERGRSFTDPIDARFTLHTGKSNQKADTVLVNKAQEGTTGGFKVQGDYYGGNKSQYWGPNHRVLDTAYVVGEYTLSEGEEELPEVEFVVKGKIVECYNYDFCYLKDPLFPSDTISNSALSIGEVVTLKKTSDNSTITTTAVIADIYTDEFSRTRIRFLNDPGLGNTTAFYIDKTNDFRLVTTDCVVSSGAVAETLRQSVSSSSFSPTLGTYSVNIPGGTSIGNTVNLNGSRFAIGDIAINNTIGNMTFDASYQARIQYGSSTRPGTGSNSTTINQISSTTSSAPTTVVSKTGIKLAASASSTNDIYNGLIIELTRTNSDGSVFTQTRTIVDYDGTNKLATVDEDWDALYLPTLETADTYAIYAQDDSRVTNNPAIQLLDYITSERYGRGLDVNIDINLESFKEAARKCDTRSDITIVLPNGTTEPSLGDIYTYISTTTKFRGMVSSKNNSNGLIEVTFTDVIGKLGKKWFDWKSYAVGDLIWNNGAVYQVTAAGIFPTWTNQPNGTGAATASVVTTSFNLTKVSGSGPSSLPVSVIDSSFDGNPIVKKYISTTRTYISGYSLYDCDDVKYWRYVGWNTQDQNYVTRHQTNVIVNTSNSVFDNINMLLGHFNGILRYNAGKYELDVESRHVTTETAYGYNQVNPDINSSFWTTAFSTKTTSAISVPSGCGPAIKLADVGTGGSPEWHQISCAISSIAPDDILIASAYLKAAEYSSAALSVRNPNNTFATAYFNLSGNGSYTDISSSIPLAGIQLIENGWYRCWIAVRGTTGATEPRFYIINDPSYGSPASVPGTTGSGILVSSAKVEDSRFLDYEYGPTPFLYYPAIISEDDIIGAISIEDPGNKDTYNTISVDIPDPRNRFEERSVTYFNSTYLLEDNSVPKKGDMKATGITNYFNARINAKQYLEKSRYGLKLNFTMPPKGVLLTAGSIIEVNNSRLGFSSKPFRIINVTINKDCLVQINADEHTNNAYLISPSSVGPFFSSEPSFSYGRVPSPISNLTVSTDQYGSIKLTWANPSSYNSGSDFVEIWRKASPSPFSGATLQASVKSANTYTDVTPSSSPVSYYYWTRVVRETYKKDTNTNVQLKSRFLPLNGSPGVQGTSLPSDPGNYNSSNDNDGSAISPSAITPVFPYIDLPFGGVNKDSTANICLYWEWTGVPTKLDGFGIYFWSSNSEQDDATIDEDEDYTQATSFYSVPTNPRLAIATLTYVGSTVTVSTERRHKLFNGTKVKILYAETTSGSVMPGVNTISSPAAFVAVTVTSPRGFTYTAPTAPSGTYSPNSGRVTSCYYTYQINNLTANYYYNAWIQPYRQVNTAISEDGIIVGSPRKLFTSP